MSLFNGKLKTPVKLRRESQRLINQILFLIALTLKVSLDQNWQKLQN